MDSSALVQIIAAVAPTVASKLTEYLKDKRLTNSEQFIILMAVNAETNTMNAKLLQKLDSRMGTVEQGIKRSCESLAILLERTK